MANTPLKKPPIMVPKWSSPDLDELLKLKARFISRTPFNIFAYLASGITFFGVIYLPARSSTELHPGLLSLIGVIAGALGAYLLALACVEFLNYNTPFPPVKMTPKMRKYIDWPKHYPATVAEVPMEVGEYSLSPPYTPPQQPLPSSPQPSSSSVRPYPATPDYVSRRGFTGKPVYSPSMHELDITSQQQLQQYLEDEQKNLQEMSPSSQYFSPSPSLFPKYRPSYRATPSPSRPDQPQDDFSPEKYNVNAEKRLHELKIENKMRVWTENMQVRLSDMFHQVSHMIDELTKVGLLIIPPSPTTPTKSHSAIANMQLSEMVQLYSGDPYVQLRMRLEMFLSLAEEKQQKEYCIMRIKELAFGTCLSAFQWNSGGVWQGRPWSSATGPCDAKLVMHVFCTYLDLHIPPDPSAPVSSKPFSSKYFVATPAKPETASGRPIIYQRILYPPHFELSTCTIKQGFNNLLYVLVIFILQVMATMSGYIDGVNISFPPLDLAYVVSNTNNE